MYSAALLRGSQVRRRSACGGLSWNLPGDVPLGCTAAAVTPCSTSLTYASVARIRRLAANSPSTRSSGASPALLAARHERGGPDCVLGPGGRLDAPVLH